MLKKDKISISIKKKVWNRAAVYYDKSYCQCETCDNFVRVPECLRKVMDIPKNKDYTIIVNNKLRKLNGVGEFGHIISEYNNGTTEVDNLIIQCKRCNVKQGKKNIEKSEIIENDKEMVDVLEEKNDIDLSENSEYCVFVKRNNERCKNISIQGNYCSIHLNNN